MKLAMLSDSIRNLYLRAQCMFLEGGLTVESVLAANEETMSSGGELAEATGKITGVAAGGYHMAYSVAIIVAIIAVIVCGMMFLFSNSNSRQELKSKLVWIFIGICIIVGAIAIVVFAESFANGILG